MSRFIEIATPLGEDLLFHSMHAHEELSRPFEYQLGLLSVKPDVPVDDILGKNVTVKLALPDDSTRYFNGYVTRFSAGGKYGRFVRYFAVVRPWLWFLSRTTDCRIFQEMTVPDIVKTVFSDEPTNDFKLELTSKYKKWTYCVQYRETDLNFVSRLMEEEGISYYIQHTDGHNTVVLTDSTGKHVATPGYEKIPFISPEQVVKPELEHISSWDFGREIQAGVYAHTDYDLERPGVKLLTQKAASRKHAPTKYEVYDYPGHYVQKPDGEQYAAVRIDEVGSQFETAQAATNAKGMCVGSLFTLEECPREDQNREHLILAANYDLEFADYEAMPEGAETGYRCSFVSMSSEQQFRPSRSTPKPFVQGPQTAVVVGPGGDEIYTDKFGRVKVQFHWDRYGKNNENSSCWIRVSHPWAGKAWGGVAIPRIGQEVIVDFLEGDPDQPIITGRVYNAEQMPPYELPGNKTQTGMVSRSSPGGSPDNFNELMFEDKKGAELVYLRAEKDYTNAVENDEVRWVGHDRWTEIDNDETNHIYHDRKETVDNNETITVHGARTETVDKNETITIHAHRSETVNAGEDVTVTGARTHTVNGVQTTTISLAEAHTVGAARAHTVGGAEAITVGAAQAVTVGAAQMVSVAGVQNVNVGKGQTISVGGNQSTAVAKNVSLVGGADETRTLTGNRETKIGKNDALSVGKDLMIKVADSISIVTGDASIIMKKDGTIQIKGKDITIEGSGKINVKASGEIVMKGSKIAQN